MPNDVRPPAPRYIVNGQADDDDEFEDQVTEARNRKVVDRVAMPTVRAAAKDRGRVFILNFRNEER